MNPASSPLQGTLFIARRFIAGRRAGSELSFQLGTQAGDLGFSGLPGLGLMAGALLGGFAGLGFTGRRSNSVRISKEG